MEWFDSAPLAMFVADFSAVRCGLNEIRRLSGGDLRACLGDRPDKVTDLALLVKSVDVNREALSFFAAASKEEARRKLPRYFGARSLSVFTEAIIALDQGATQLDYEIPSLPIRGEDKLIALSLRVVAGHEEALSAVLVSFSDITARRRAEEAQRKAQHECDRFREFLDAADSLLVVLDSSGAVAFANRRACMMLGRKECDLIGKEWFELVLPGEARERTRAAFDDIIAGRVDPWDFIEGPFVTKDREERYIAWHHTLLRDEGGGGVALLSSGKDVTDSKRAEEALRDSEARFRVLAETAPIGVYLTDQLGRCIYVNQRWCELAGLRPEEARGDGWIRGLHADDREAVHASWQRMVEARGRWGLEYRFQDRAGKVTWVYGVATMMPGGREFLGINVDITERKRADEILRESDKRKSEFLAVLSHELRNPLAPIRNSLYILERMAPDSKQARMAHAVIGRQVTHLTRLIEDLLDITRIERGKIQLQRERLELGEVLRRAMDDHQADYEAKGIHVEGRFGSELFWINGDVTRISQVVTNLLANEAKFTPRGGQVVISLHREGSMVVLRTRDNGVGIAPEMIECLFQPFAQAPQSLARVHGGLGLGLALVRRTQRSPSGTIGVEDRRAPSSFGDVGQPFSDLLHHLLGRQVVQRLYIEHRRKITRPEPLHRLQE